MKLNKLSLVYLVAGILTVVATLSVFLVNSNQEFALHIWLGFFAMIYGEVAFFGGMMFIEKYAQERNLLILRTGGGIVVGVYAFFTFVLSFIYMNIEYASVLTFLSFLVILLVYTLIVEFIFIFVSRRVYKKDTRTQADMAKAKYLEQLEVISLDEPYQERINALKDKVASLDNATILTMELPWLDTIAKLQEEAFVYSPENEMKVNELITILEGLSVPQITPTA